MGLEPTKKAIALIPQVSSVPGASLVLAVIVAVPVVALVNPNLALPEAATG